MRGFTYQLTICDRVRATGLALGLSVLAESEEVMQF